MPTITEDNIETVTEALLYAQLLQQEKIACALEAIVKTLNSPGRYARVGYR